MQEICRQIFLLQGKLPRTHTKYWSSRGCARKEDSKKRIQHQYGRRYTIIKRDRQYPLGRRTVRRRHMRQSATFLVTISRNIMFHAALHIIYKTKAKLEVASMAATSPYNYRGFCGLLALMGRELKYIRLHIWGR